MKSKWKGNDQELIQSDPTLKPKRERSTHMHTHKFIDVHKFINVRIRHARTVSTKRLLMRGNTMFSSRNNYKLLNVYCEIFGTSSYGEGRTSLRIFQNIHSITFLLYTFYIDLLVSSVLSI